MTQRQLHHRMSAPAWETAYVKLQPLRSLQDFEVDWQVESLLQAAWLMQKSLPSNLDGGRISSRQLGRQENLPQAACLVRDSYALAVVYAFHAVEITEL